MFFFNDPATTHIYTYLHTLSLHDALPICSSTVAGSSRRGRPTRFSRIHARTAVLAANATNPAAKLTSVARASLRWGERLDDAARSEEHTSELQSLMRISYAVFCLKKKIHFPDQLKHVPNQET